MRKIYIIIVGLIIVLILLAIKFTLNNKEVIYLKDLEVDSNQYEQLKEQIVKIESKVIDLTAPNALKYVDEFIVLLKENKEKTALPLIYHFLADTSISELNKRILIYSLNEIALDDYCNVFEYSMSLYKGKVIDDVIILAIIFQGYDWNCLLAQNYKDKRVRKIMKKNYKILPNNYKEIFDSVLSGHMWMSIEYNRSL